MLSSLRIHGTILFIWYIFWPPGEVTDIRLYLGYSVGVALIILSRLIYHYVTHPPERNNRS